MNANRFNVWVWHRRCGKTVAAVNKLIRDVMRCEHPNPRGAYIAPFQRQARDVAFQYLCDFTENIGRDINKSDLAIQLPNKGIIQMLGANNNAHSLRGRYLDSAVLDEVAQMPSFLWGEIVRPALSDRSGGSLSIGTPWGMANLFYEQYRDAIRKPTWARSYMPWDQTGALPLEEIESLKLDMTQEEFDQEYCLDWNAAVRGAYYAKYMAEAEREGRIGNVPWDRETKVHVSMDLGMADLFVIGYWQICGSEIHLIDVDTYQNTGLTEIVKGMQAKPYVYGTYLLPHDIKVRELGTGRSRLETLDNLGISGVVVPNLGINDGINAFRQLLPRMWMDREKCFKAIEAAKTYRADYNPVRDVYQTKPLHSWESHYCDMLRYFAVGFDQIGDWQQLDYTQQDAYMV